MCTQACASALQRIQDMEERRIERIGEAMRSLAEAERKVLPVVSRCLDAMMEAAESIQPRKVRVLGLRPQNQTPDLDWANLP